MNQPCEIAEIVRQAQSGDREAFNRLAAYYREAVAAVAFLKTGSREEAEDLTQEILLRAWQSLPALLEPSAFAGWLRAIAQNACRSWLRRSRPWPVSLDSSSAREIADPQPGPLEAVLKREREHAVRKALLNLPEANCLALLLHVWGGYSYEEIAAFTGVPVTTIEGRIFRAKAKLRRLLRSEAADLPGLPRRLRQKEEIQ